VNIRGLSVWDVFSAIGIENSLKNGILLCTSWHGPCVCSCEMGARPCVL